MKPGVMRRQYAVDQVDRRKTVIMLPSDVPDHNF